MSSSSSRKERKEQPITAISVSSKTSSKYPADFSAVVAGRAKRALGDHFALQNFGVNHTTLQPGAASALQHTHAKQDEFVFILQGTAVCQLDEEEYVMEAGDCMGFPAGDGVMHSILNKSGAPVVYLEIGDRSPDDLVDYGNGVDLRAVGNGAGFTFLRRDGTPYETGK